MQIASGITPRTRLLLFWVVSRPPFFPSKAEDADTLNVRVALPTRRSQPNHPMPTTSMPHSAPHPQTPTTSKTYASYPKLIHKPLNNFCG